MNDALLSMLPKLKKFDDYLADVKKDNFPIHVAGLGVTPKVHFAYATKTLTERPILIVTYNDIELKKMVNDLKFFEEDEILVYPKREVVYYDIDTMSKDATMDRLNVYTKLYNSEAKVIVTTIEALLQKTIAKDTLFSKVISLEFGKSF